MDTKSLLIHTIEASFAGKAWQGPTLTGSLRGVTPRVALFRPARGRECIWEQVLHAAYWKYIVANTLSGSEAAGLGRSPANWPAVPEVPDVKAWKKDLALLRAMHERVIKAVEGLDTNRLDERPAGKKVRLVQFAAGIAAHDAYHTGQIQLLKRLAGA